MCDVHQMVVHNICEVIGRETVGLDQDHIVKLDVRNGDVAVQFIRECRRALFRIILTDDIWLASREVCLNLFLRKV